MPLANALCLRLWIGLLSEGWTVVGNSFPIRFMLIESNKMIWCFHTFNYFKSVLHVNYLISVRVWLFTVWLLWPGSVKIIQSDYRRWTMNSNLSSSNHSWADGKPIGSNNFNYNSLFMPCNLIGQFCLSDPGYSSRTENISLVYSSVLFPLYVVLLILLLYTSTSALSLPLFLTYLSNKLCLSVCVMYVCNNRVLLKKNGTGGA